MTSSSVGQLADNVTEVVGDALSTGKELASGAAKHLPEVTDSVSKVARTSAATVADLATTALALTPFVNGTSRRRRRPWWIMPAVGIALLGVFAAWKRTRGKTTSHPTTISGPAALRSIDDSDDVELVSSARSA